MAKKDGMRSLARNMNAEVAGVPSNKEPWYPSLTINEDVLPELKGCNVGAKGKILVEYCVKGIHKYGNGEIEYNLDLEKGDIVEEAGEDEGRKG